MLQDLRQSTKGPTAKIVVGVIVVSFALFGIESILLGGGSNGVAEVNGEEISPQELQQAVNTQKRRLISMLGENLDPAMLDDQALSVQAMDSLINRKLLTQSASAMELAVSEGAIGALIGSMEQFQVNGQFSSDVYKSVLSSAGYTPASFKRNLREDMVLNQLRSGLAGSEFATTSELALNARIVAEQRDIRYLTIPLENFSVSTDVSGEDIQNYYESNQSDFRTRESVDLDYIELTAADFLQPVEEAAIVEAYELASQSSQYQTESRVSHILFQVADGETEEVLQLRVAAAQARLDAGEDFATVAAELSDDVGSAGSGGDLGYSSGDVFPEEMEVAIAELEIDVVSVPVQTESGTHLIVVTERNEGAIASLEEMRAELESALQAEEARIVLLRTVETLKDLSFNAEDLNSPAQELDLEVEQVDGVNRSQADGLFANSSLLSVAFSEDVLEAGHNSEVVELGGDRFVVLRVSRHNKPEIKPLDLVRDDIVAAIVERTARAAVTAEAERAILALRSGTSVEDFALAKNYEWQVELAAERRSPTVPAGILQRAFELPVPQEGEPAIDFILTDSGDAQVLELVRVSAGEYDALAAAQQQGLQQQVSSEYASLVDNEYQRGLRDAADITVL
jgi:peptidyl-prolyl cis-trans isomerase D